jgi:hypothetical protein
LYILATRLGKDSNDLYVVTDNEYAQEINPKWNNANIQTLLAQMVAEGFINYFFDQHKIVLRDKLIHKIHDQRIECQPQPKNKGNDYQSRKKPGIEQPATRGCYSQRQRIDIAKKPRHETFWSPFCRLRAL